MNRMLGRKVLKTFLTTHVLFNLMTLSKGLEFQETCEVICLPSVNNSLKGKFLEGFTLKSLTLQNKYFCMKRYLLQKQCKSINYQTDSLLCQLNSETHSSRPTSIKAEAGSLQYFTIDDANEAILGRCEGYNCPDDNLCDPLPYGYSDAYKCVPESTDSESLTTFSTCIVTDGCTYCMPSQFVIGTIQFRPIGCYYAGASPNLLSTLLSNMRTNIDWNNLKSTIEACATITNNSGYKYFGIEFWGECWVSMDFDSTSSIPVPGASCEIDCYKGVAAANIMFVYDMLIFSAQ